MATALPTQPKRRFTWTWLGLVPFFAFSILFIFLPSASLFIDSFRNREGQFTLENIFALFQPPIPASYLLSIQISLATAVMGGILGFFLAYALDRRQPAALDPSGHAHVCRRCLQLRGRAPGVRLHRHVGAGGIPHHAAEELPGLEHLRQRLQPLRFPGLEPGVHVLPVPADVADHDASHRGAEAGVARGGGEPGGQRHAILGCASACPS